MVNMNNLTIDAQIDLKRREIQHQQQLLQQLIDKKAAKCPNLCDYDDQDAVICNEEPWNCPINQGKIERPESRGLTSEVSKL